MPTSVSTGGKRPFRRIRRFTPLLGLGLLLCLAALVPLKSERLKTWVLAQVGQQLGHPLEVGDVRLQLFPRIHLDLSEVALYDPDAAAVLFQAGRITLILRLRPLVNGRLAVKRLTVDGPQIELRRDQHGQWNMRGEGTAEPRGAEDLPGLILAAISGIKETNLKHGEIRVIDETGGDRSRTIHLRDVTAKVTTAATGLPFQVSVSAKAETETAAPDFMLAGRIRQASTPLQIATDAAEGPRTLLAFDGLAEIQNLDLDAIARDWGVAPAPETSFPPVRIRTAVHLTPGDAGYDVRLPDLHVDMAPLSLHGAVSLSGLLTDHPAVHATAASLPVTLEGVVQRFRVRRLMPDAFRIINEYAIGGTIELLNMRTTWTLGSKEPDISGTLRIQDGQALAGAARTPVGAVSAIVDFDENAIQITELTGLYGPLRVTGGTAALAFRPQAPRLDLAVTGDLPAQGLVETLLNLDLPNEAKTALAKLHETAGETAVVLRVTGDPTKPDGITVSRAEIAFTKVAFRVDGLAEPVQNLTGYLELFQDTVAAHQLAWHLGPSQFSMDGQMSMGPESRFHDVDIKGLVEASFLAGLTTTPLIPPSTLRGWMAVALRLSGTIQHPGLQGTIGLTDTAVSLPGILSKPAGQPAQVTWTATIGAGQTLKMQRMEVHLPGIRLRGRGTAGFGSLFTIDASLVSDAISLAAAAVQGLPVSSLERGTLELTLAIKGTGLDWRAWQYRGWLALTDGAVAAGPIEHPVEDVYLRARLTGHGADIKRLSLRINDSHLVLSGWVKHWNTVPRGDLHIVASALDLDLLVPKGERSPVRDLLEDLAADAHLEATVDVDHGWYKDLSVVGVSGRARIGDGLIEVPRLTGRIDQGTFVIHGKVNLPKQRPAEVDLSMHVAELPFQSLERVAGDRDRLISGNFSAQAAIHAHGRDPRGVLPSLEGAVAFSIKHGHFKGGTVLPRILAILNLPSLLQGHVDLSKEGVPFERIKGSFAIKDGLVREENLVLDSPVIKMSAAGNYDLVSDQVKAVVAVSPLGSYSAFLKSIPLFGKIFVGERQGFDTALFEVTGSLHEPTVSYLPLQSFTTGMTGLAHLAFDVLKNTLLLPTTFLPGEEG